MFDDGEVIAEIVSTQFVGLKKKKKKGFVFSKRCIAEVLLLRHREA